MLFSVILCYFLVLSLIFFDMLLCYFPAILWLFYVMFCFFVFDSQMRQQNRHKSRAEFSLQGARFFISGGSGMGGLGMLSCDLF